MILGGGKVCQPLWWMAWSTMVGNCSFLALSLQRKRCTQVWKGEKKSGWMVVERTKGLTQDIQGTRWNVTRGQAILWHYVSFSKIDRVLGGCQSSKRLITIINATGCIYMARVNKWFLYDVAFLRVSCSAYKFYGIRQSTCLIRVENLTILTDPVFTQCTINDHLGPKRLRPIPCTLEEVQPYLDIVLVSHDHFDHLGNMTWMLTE